MGLAHRSWVLIVALVAAPVMAQPVDNGTAPGRDPGGAGDPPIRYVTDRLDVPLHEGPGRREPITGTVASGTPLRVRERGPDGAFVRVTGTEGEASGWIRAAYLSEQTPARQALEAVRRELEALRARHERLLRQSEGMAPGAATDQPEPSDRGAGNGTLGSPEASTDAFEIGAAAPSDNALQQRVLELQDKLIDLRRQRDETVARLRGEIESLKQSTGPEDTAEAGDHDNRLKERIQRLEQRNRELTRQNGYYWLAAGGGLLFLGLLLGLVVRGRRPAASA